MEVYASRNRGKAPPVCHRCGQPGHFKNQCPMRFDVRFMSTEELEDHLQNQLIQKDTIAAMAASTMIRESEESIEAEVEEGFQESSE
jgi:Zinc knuckle